MGQALDQFDLIMESVAPSLAEADKLKEAIDKYIIDKYEAGDGYESEDYKATKVVGYMRSWDAEKLEKIVPKGILKNITELKVIPEKINEYVKSGTLKLEKIAPAYTETPKAPYVKITRKSASGEGEAAKLAEKL